MSRKAAHLSSGARKVEVVTAMAVDVIEERAK